MKINRRLIADIEMVNVQTYASNIRIFLFFCSYSIERPNFCIVLHRVCPWWNRQPRILFNGQTLFICIVYSIFKINIKRLLTVIPGTVLLGVLISPTFSTFIIGEPPIEKILLGVDSMVAVNAENVEIFFYKSASGRPSRSGGSENVFRRGKAVNWRCLWANDSERDK